MESSTSRRLLAVLTFALVGGSMTFLVGARAGAALDGHVNGMTFANIRMPRAEAAAIQHVQAPLIEVANK